jgi:hypothetical protein
MEFTGAINEGVLIPFLNGDAVIQEEREVISHLAETGGPIFWSMLVQNGRGRVGRRFASGGEGITVGASLCVVEIHIFPAASAVWLGGVW